jgi:phosphohistidine phosphatase SixA
MLVGHEPSFSATAEKLCHQTWHGYIALKTTGCICLEVFCDPQEDSIEAQLLWMTTPKMLLALSGE